MFRKLVKRWIYGSCPGIRGSFPYYGTRVFFPPGSASFRAACEQGIFEYDNLRILMGEACPGSWMFDIGANIGLMAVPVLSQNPNVHVLSFEPSPNSLPSLRRTMEASKHRARWQLVPKAVGAKCGNVTFYLASAENSLFDGVRDTGRSQGVGSVTVEMTTVDAEWNQLGKPVVSIIKCDIEGGELEMLHGAKNCLETCRPSVLLEWHSQNLAACQVAPEALLHFAEQNGYKVYAVPALAEVKTLRVLTAHMALTESFLLLPS